MLAMAAGQGILGAIGGGKRERAAKQAQYNNEIKSSVDTRFSPYVNTRIAQEAVPDAGPGKMGGFLSGALSGASQGMKIGDWLKDNAASTAAKGAMGNLDKFQVTKPKPVGFNMGQGFQSNMPQNPYAALGGGY